MKLYLLHTYFHVKPGHKLGLPLCYIPWGPAAITSVFLAGFAPWRQGFAYLQLFVMVKDDMRASLTFLFIFKRWVIGDIQCFYQPLCAVFQPWVIIEAWFYPSGSVNPIQWFGGVQTNKKSIHWNIQKAQSYWPHRALTQASEPGGGEELCAEGHLPYALRVRPQTKARPLDC